MSDDVFPTLPGLAWDVVKAPEFSTGVQRAADMSELRASFSTAPVWHFKLKYDVLRDDTLNNELKQLGGFFLSHYGRWDSWLFTDPDDSVATGQVFATGNGSATKFQLTRAFGAFNEPVAAANITQMTVANTPTANYTLAANGAVTFVSAPSANAPIAWTGTYLFRCRFTEDTMEFAQFMRQLWEAQTVEFVASLGTKI